VNEVLADAMFEAIANTVPVRMIDIELRSVVIFSFANKVSGYPRINLGGTMRREAFARIHAFCYSRNLKINDSPVAYLSPCHYVCTDLAQSMLCKWVFTQITTSN